MVIVDDDRSAIRLPAAGEPLVAALRGLTALPPATPDLEPGTAQQLAEVVRAATSMLATHLVHDGRVLLSIEATAPQPYRPTAIDDGTPVRLSKFALVHRRKDLLVLESPAARHRAVLADRDVRALVTELAVPSTAAELANRVPLDVTVIVDVLAQLAGAGLLDVADRSRHFPADDDPALRQWEPADLFLHARSRIGRSDEPLGGRFSYYGAIEPLPAVRPLPAGERIALPRPDLADILARDPALVTAMEARQSTRTFGEQPMTIAQLGEFLYRVARVRGTYGPRHDRGMPYEASSRPYPCGGAEYELELYLTVARCDGLAAASYFYDPAGHQLVRLPTGDDEQAALLDLAAASTGAQARPDVLVTVTSRFARLAWKYRALAYALTLRHVGALYQNMYLVAAASGLGGCALGTGDAELSARAFGLDYLVESSVGDFVLGSVAGSSRPESERGEPDWRPVNDPQWQAESRARLNRPDSG